MISSRVDALRAIADKLPELLPEALAATKAIRCEIYHAKALIALASKLSKMQTGELFLFWQNTLHSLSFLGYFLTDFLNILF